MSLLHILETCMLLAQASKSIIHIPNLSETQVMHLQKTIEYCKTICDFKHTIKN